MDDAENQNLVQAISLLRKLLDNAPTDTRNRMRLLTLLSKQENSREFLQEVDQLLQSDEPLLPESWEHICKMARFTETNDALFSRAHPISTQNDSESANTHGDEGSNERRDGKDRRLNDRRKNVSTWTGDERRYWQNRRKNFRRQKDAKAHKPGS